MIKVYTLPDCPWCKKAKAYLQSKGIDYIDVNVEEDMEARREFLALSKQQSLPVLNINGNIVIGYDKEQIDKYINAAI
ncbi:MAG: glutaredoxin domain-containing protein [Clostridiaceae bacterium]